MTKALAELIRDANREITPADRHAILDLIEQQSDRISEFEAARIAYASEFPPDAEGLPDVGNIHANIRAMKADGERYRWLRDHHIGDDPEAIELTPAAQYGLDAAIDDAIETEKK